MSISTKFQEHLENGDMFFPMSKWPVLARERMLKRHKVNNERYYLMRFFTYNGLAPEVASNWILREGDYDEEAIRDQKAMTIKAKHVDFFRKGRIFNMRLGRTDTAEETTQVGSQPPLSTPQTKAPPASVPWEKVLDMFPRPTRSEFDDEFEFQLAFHTWKAETRSAIDRWKSQGLTMDF